MELQKTTEQKFVLSIRMNDKKIPKSVLKYNHKGRTDFGRLMSEQAFSLAL